MTAIVASQASSQPDLHNGGMQAARQLFDT
jgi:hypothetical protein